MLTFVAVIHLVVAIFLVLFVLLQDSKGGAMGVLGGGGGSNSLFGSTGAGNFLVKLTTWTAIVFSITCIYLAYQSGADKGSVLDNYVAPATNSQPLDKAVDGKAPVPAEKTTPKESDKK